MDWPGETATDLWTFRDSGRSGVNASAGIDLIGFDVEAIDGGIGKVDQATYDTDRSYIVVDTDPQTTYRITSSEQDNAPSCVCESAGPDLRQVVRGLSASPSRDREWSVRPHAPSDSFCWAANPPFRPVEGA